MIIKHLVKATITLVLFYISLFKLTDFANGPPSVLTTVDINLSKEQDIKSVYFSPLDINCFYFFKESSNGFMCKKIDMPSNQTLSFHSITPSALNLIVNNENGSKNGYKLLYKGKANQYDLEKIVDNNYITYNQYTIYYIKKAIIVFVSILLLLLLLDILIFRKTKKVFKYNIWASVIMSLFIVGVSYGILIKEMF